MRLQAVPAEIRFVPGPRSSEIAPLGTTVIKPCAPLNLAFQTSDKDRNEAACAMRRRGGYVPPHSRCRYFRRRSFAMSPLLAGIAARSISRRVGGAPVAHVHLDVSARRTEQT